MLRRTQASHYYRDRHISDLLYKGHGPTHSGHKTPYRVWQWKQEELFRNIFEEQYFVLRKQYKRQWYDSYRVNADEYLAKYNITKAAQVKQWEREMETQEHKRQQEYQMTAARQALKRKHLDLMLEMGEKHFFYWYERSSERLQQLERIRFVTKNNYQSVIERELDKYVYEPENPKKNYPLNMVGQLPLLEDKFGNITAATQQQAMSIRAMYPDIPIAVWEPPKDDETQTTGGGLVAGRITSKVQESWDGFSAGDEQQQQGGEDAARMARIIDDHLGATDQDDIMEKEDSEEDHEVKRRAAIEKAKGSNAFVRSKSALDETLTKAEARPVDSPTLEQARNESRRLDRAQRKGSGEVKVGQKAKWGTHTEKPTVSAEVVEQSKLITKMQMAGDIVAPGAPDEHGRDAIKERLEKARQAAAEKKARRNLGKKPE